MIRVFRSRKPALLGHLENTVMDVVWARGESSVREVVDLLDRPLAYTTVMTTLDRLYKKGLLDRRKFNRAFVYSPRMSRSQWEQELAGSLVAGLLAGPHNSSEVLISCLVDAVGQRDQAVLEELERRIREKRRELEQRNK
ncbi:MAG TPA: BlaI/MecI/CopY family transcriptional regulator [Bryobacteraceae bacterium]|nr:BlaI/MecI/CopY family transcriptional regulator [Bryobacteraceae bacterium]